VSISHIQGKAYSFRAPKPQLDRACIDSRKSIGVNRSKLASLILFVLVIASLSTAGILFIGHEDSIKSTTAAYTPHAPITIVSNVNFAVQAVLEGWPGDGSASNPYIIKDSATGNGYEIDASGYEAGIDVRNTDVHFIIDSAWVHGATYHGILFFDVDNGIIRNGILDLNNNGIRLIDYDLMQGCVIENNDCDSNEVGISLEGWQQGCIIRNNTCDSNNNAGIGISGSWDLWNNTCALNGNYGILVSGSPGSNIENNTCDTNGYSGICLSFSQGCRLRNNTMLSDGVFLEGDNVLQFNTADIDTSNTVNARPVLYYANASGFTVPSGAGQVLLANCTYAHVEDLSLDDVDYGIEVAFCSNVTIAGNSVSNCNLTGIYVMACNSIAVQDNTCNLNRGGIDLTSCQNCSIRNNTCNSNTQHGIYVYSSLNYSIENNICSSNTREGIVVDGSYIFVTTSVRIVNNSCDSNGEWGLYVTMYRSCLIRNNTCDLNVGSGMYIGISDCCRIEENTCSSNQYDGIFVEGSQYVNITNNLLSQNTRYGVFLTDYCSHSRVWNNSFEFNHGSTSTYDRTKMQAADTGTDNYWNTSGSPHGYGNYWTDWTSPDSNLDGIVDAPYEIDGSALAGDWYPLTQYPYIPEFSSGLVFISLMMLTLGLMILIRRGNRK